MEIDFSNLENTVPRLDLRLPDKTSKPLWITGPLAAAFKRAYQRALGFDKVPADRLVDLSNQVEQGTITEAEASVKAASLTGRSGPDDAIVVEAVDGLLAKDFPELRGRLPLAMYQAIFQEVATLISTGKKETPDSKK